MNVKDSHLSPFLKHRLLAKIDALSIVEVDATTQDNLTEQIGALLQDASSRLSIHQGGHVPEDIVQNYIKRSYTSWEALTVTFPRYGRRICLFDGDGQLVSSLLIARDPELALMFDSRNIGVPIASTGLPRSNLHQIFNFTTNYSQRRKGFGKLLLTWIQMHWSEMNLRGNGIWTFVEPPDYQLYRTLGFDHLPSSDQYFFNDPPHAEEFNRRYLTAIGMQLPKDNRCQIKCFYMQRKWTPAI